MPLEISLPSRMVDRFFQERWRLAPFPQPSPSPKRFSSAVAAVYDRRYFVDSAKNRRSLERRYSKNRTRDSVVLQHAQLRRGMVQSRCANENTELPDRPDCSQLEHHDGDRDPGHT